MVTCINVFIYLTTFIIFIICTYSSKIFENINLFNLHNTSIEFFFFFLMSDEKTGREKLRNISKVIELGSGEAGI